MIWTIEDRNQTQLREDFDRLTSKNTTITICCCYQNGCIVVVFGMQHIWWTPLIVLVLQCCLFVVCCLLFVSCFSFLFFTTCLFFITASSLFYTTWISRKPPPTYVTHIFTSKFWRASSDNETNKEFFAHFSNLGVFRLKHFLFSFFLRLNSYLFSSVSPFFWGVHFVFVTVGAFVCFVLVLLVIVQTLLTFWLCFCVSLSYFFQLLTMECLGKIPCVQAILHRWNVLSAMALVSWLCGLFRLRISMCCEETCDEIGLCAQHWSCI
jgi:hypothetical protein